jgi:mRNA interferase RelE/StbE
LSEFRIFETEEFLRALEKLPEADSRFLRRKLDGHVYPQLREEPFFGRSIRKLRAYVPDTWRYRIGRFRLFYTIDEVDRLVFVLTVDLRRSAYR